MVDHLSKASRFVIEETSGSRRRIELIGRALPYQGVTWGGTMKTKMVWYPGNPRGTIQVLGPTEEPTTIQGMWKDRFLPGQVNAIGFPDLAEGVLITAENLVVAFESIRRSGNRLRVQWSNIVREGVLTSFNPRWIRLQDVEWEAEFTWFSAEIDPPRASPSRPDSGTQLRQGLDAIDYASYGRPARVARAVSTRIAAVAAQTRTTIATAFEALRLLQRSGSGEQAKISAVQALSSAADSLRIGLGDSVEQLTDTPITDATLSDSVVDLLSIDGWRRSVASAQTSLSARGLEVATAERTAVLPEALATIVVPGDTSLRAISQTYYGSADDWERIARANSIVGSLVAAGTLIVIPRPGAGEGL